MHSKYTSINSFLGGRGTAFVFFLHRKAGAGSHHFESAMGREAFLLAGAKEEWKDKIYVADGRRERENG